MEQSEACDTTLMRVQDMRPRLIQLPAHMASPLSKVAEVPETQCAVDRCACKQPVAGAYTQQVAMHVQVSEPGECQVSAPGLKAVKS